MITECGIRGIYLSGTKQDWEKIIAKTNLLAKLDDTLAKWVSCLQQILQHFVKAFDGEFSETFWDSIYKYWDAGSGGPYVSGWISSFYLYILYYGDKLVPNSYALKPYKHTNDTKKEPKKEEKEEKKEKEDSENSDDYQEPEGYSYQLSPNNFPQGLAKAPVNWKYLGETIKLEFLGGVIGACQMEDTQALVPKFGWAVVERIEEPEKS